MRVHVYAVIYRELQVVVVRGRRQGRLYRSLPGGRVNPRESLAVALTREVREETGLEAKPGRLLLVAEVRGGGHAAELVLVFAARAEGPIDDDLSVELVEPGSPDAPPVYPPVLAELAAHRDGDVRWLGNIFDPRFGGDLRWRPRVTTAGGATA